MPQYCFAAVIPLLLCSSCHVSPQRVTSGQSIMPPQTIEVEAARVDSITLAALEQKLEDAVVRRDVAFLDSIWSPTFRFTHAGGTVQSRSELLAEFRRRPAATGGRTLARKVDSVGVEIHPNVAVTTGRIHVRRASEAVISVYTIRFIRVYERRAGGQWQQLSHHTLGQPVPAS